MDFIRETGVDYYRSQLWYCEAGTPIHQQREKYGIEGDGFVWSHASMESMEAMDWIEKMFLSTGDSVWLPQWSFDFWIIPYLIGKGVKMDDFRDFMRGAQKLMALGVAYVPEPERGRMENELLQGLVGVAKRWDSVA
jgi:p-methyltransferase